MDEPKPMAELTRIREERGLSQQGLADASGVNKATINQIERGRRSPNARTLEKLAAALGVEMGDFFPLAQAPLPEFDEERRLRYLRAMRAIVHGLARRWREQSPQTSREIAPLYEALTAVVEQGVFEPSDVSAAEDHELMLLMLGFQRLNDIADKVEKNEEAEERRATFALIQKKAS